MALSGHFVLDLFTHGKVRVARVRRRSGTRASGVESSSERCGPNEKATVWGLFHFLFQSLEASELCENQGHQECSPW